MAMRMGEMMVVIRAQDFASRTLRRVGAEMTGLSKAQALARSQSRLDMRADRAGFRMRQLRDTQRNLDLLKTQIDLEQRLSRIRRGTPAQTIISPRGEKRLIPAQAPRFVTGQFASPTELAKLDSALASVQKRVATMPNLYKKMGDSSRDLGLRQAEMAAQSAKVAQALRLARPELAFIAEDQEVLNQAVRAAPLERLNSLGHALSGIGRTMQLFGAIGTVSFGIAAKAAADFSTSISLAATQARDINAPVAQVKLRMDQLTNGVQANGVELDGVIGLMQRYPASAEDMSAASYEIFSSMNLERNGVMDVAKGLELLENANQIAVAGGADLEEATSAMITVLNNFDPQLKNTTENFDTMFDIVRFGRLRLADFNIMMNKIAPAAADAGNNLEDVGGAMAFLTQKMPSQRMVATGISRLLEALRNPDIVEGLKIFGVNAKDATGKLRPLDQLLGDIAQRFPELRTGQKSAAEFFREISAAGRGGGRGQLFTAEGRRSFSLIMHDMDGYLVRQRQIEKNTGEFGNTLQAQLETIGVQWGIFTNQLRSLLIVVGTDAIPVFVAIGGAIQKFTKWFRELDKETRSQIIRWATIVSVATLLAGVVLAIAGSIVSFVAMMRLAGINVTATTAKLALLRNLLRGLAAFTAISLTIKALWGGDLTAIDFVKAAIAGGLLGARAGIGGAVLGAITLPILLKVMSDNANESPIQKEYEKYVKEAKSSQNILRQAFDPDIFGVVDISSWMPRRSQKVIKGDIQTFKEFVAAKKALAKLDAMRPARESGGLEDTAAAAEAATKATKKYKDELGDYYKKLQEGRDLSKQYAEDMKLWNAQLAQATEQATKTATDNVLALYDGLRTANQSLFGELGQGPWLTSETFDIASEWGIAPGVADLTRDIHDQRVAFNALNADLAKIAKRGGPKDLIDQLKKMGPEGAALIDQIANARPGQFKSLVTEYKKAQAAINKATKQDFTKTINEFEKAGKDMGQAILDGFDSIDVGGDIQKWITVEFPTLISAGVATEVKTWKETNLPPTNKAVDPGDPPVDPNAKNGPTKEQTRQVALWKKNVKELNLSQVRKELKRVETAYNSLSTHLSYGPRTPEQAQRLSYLKTRLNRLQKRESMLMNQQMQGRALGGRVVRGRKYIVGERGPEMFMPSRSGNIVNNRNTENSSNDSSKHITLNYNIEGGTPGDQDRARRDAFIIKQRMKSWL